MKEWKQLLNEARELGITVKEIEEFFNSTKDENGGILHGRTIKANIRRIKRNEKRYARLEA